MATLASISAALENTAVKKSSLRESYDNLKALSSSLSSFTLQWEDVEEHLNSIQSQIELKFKQLEDHAEKLKELDDHAEKSQTPAAAEPSSVQPRPETVAIQPRPQLKAFCTGMDGKGLIKYINENTKRRETIKKEVLSALTCSPDPASLVLDAIGGFFSSSPKGEKDPKTKISRRNCITLLEELTKIKQDISSQAKERAKTVAIEWKGKVSTSGENVLEALCFLQLLASYGLGAEFDAKTLVQFFAVCSRNSQVLPLSHILLSSEDIPNVIQKLIDDNKQNFAMKYIFEYGLTEKFPPVPLLKAIIAQSKKDAKKVREDGNNSLQSLNEATAKEISALNQVIKFVEDYRLDSEYPKVNLEKRLEQLENEKKNRKRPASTTASKPQKQQAKSQKQKRPRVAPAVPALRLSHMPATGLLADRSATYLTPSGYHGPVTAKYPTATPRIYSLGGTAAGYANKLSPSRAPLYSGLSSAYHDRPAAYGGYGLPAYYPQ